MTKSRYIHKKYFQKSLNFLFPLLGLKREMTFVPVGTYLWWNGGESIEDKYLLVGYEADFESSVFKAFEKKNLLAHPDLHKCYDVEGGRIYVFDMVRHSDTVDKFLEGKYSKFSEKDKRKILSYHDASLEKEPRPGRYIHMTLYPELYYEQVARDLEGVSVETLREVGELTNRYDKTNETLNIKIIGECHKDKIAI